MADNDNDILIEKLSGSTNPLKQYVCYLRRYVDEYPAIGLGVMYGKTPAVIKATIRRKFTHYKIDINKYNIVVKGEQR
jgi:hypothetical protein